MAGGSPEPMLRPSLLSPAQENATIRKLLLPGLKADFQVIETWTAPSPGPSAVLPCCVAALGARQDNRYTPPQLAAWEAVAPHAGFENWWFDGGHRCAAGGGEARGAGGGPARGAARLP